MKRFSAILAMVLVCTFAFVIASFAAEEPLLSSDAKVYVDYASGKDTNNGATASTAVKLFTPAMEHVADGGTIVACGKLFIGASIKIEANGTILITSNDGTANYKNFEPATNPACAMKMGVGATLTVASDVIIDDIILFQEYSTSNTIKVTNNSTLVIGDKVDTLGSPHSDGPCFVKLVVEEGSTLIVKGGTFQSITGEGTVVNEGATVIEDETYETYATAANALHAAGVIDGYAYVKDALPAAEAVTLIENLAGYTATFENETVSAEVFLGALLTALGQTDVTDVFAASNALGLIDGTTVETFNRGEAFVICVKALDVDVNGATVAQKLVADGKLTQRALGFAKRIAAGETIIVACVGDSITEGAGSTSVAKYSYPAQLQKLLGEGFKVVNCGKSGAYVMNLESEYNAKAEDRPDLWYPATTQYQTLMASEADIVIVMLGTNDARSMTAMPAEDVFVTDYKNLIADIAALESNPEIYLSTMIPAVNADMTHQGTFYTLPKLIKGVADELDLPLVDTSAALWQYYYAVLPYGDSVHPTDETYPALATNFYNQVFGYSKELPVLEAADGNVVYLSSKGSMTASGATPAEAVDTLSVAVAKLAENGGTVVVCDAVDVKRTHFAACGGEVVITSVYGGVDYRKDGAALKIDGFITLLSDVKLENVNIVATSKDQGFNCGFNNFTVGEGVECSGEYTLNITAGYRMASGVITSETVSCHEDCTISIASGKWSFVRGGNQRTDPKNQIGTVDEGAKLSIYISGGEFVHVGTTSVNTLTGQNNVAGEVYMEISDGKFAGDVCAISRMGTNQTETTPAVTGTVTLKVTGGEFGGRIALYQNDDSPRVSGTSTLIVGKPYENAVDTTGFDTVTVIDVVTTLGDANGDGAVNMLDALRILKHLVDENLDIWGLNSDLDKDGEITVADALEVFKKIINA